MIGPPPPDDIDVNCEAREFLSCCSSSARYDFVTVSVDTVRGGVMICCITCGCTTLGEDVVWFVVGLVLGFVEALPVRRLRLEVLSMLTFVIATFLAKLALLVALCLWHFLVRTRARG